MPAPATSAERRASLTPETSLRRCLSSIHAADRDAGEGRRRRHEQDNPRASVLRGRVDPRDGPPSPDQLPTLPFVGRRGNSRGPAKKFQRRHSPVATDENDHRRGRGSMGFRMDYSLGEALRTPNDTIAHASSQEAVAAVESLQKHDFAFVKRSDGSFSYAILCHRSFEPAKGSSCKEECMTFVMSNNGSTKIVRRRHWAKFVKLAIAGSQDSNCRPRSPFSVEDTPAAPPSAEDVHAAIESGQLVFCQEIPPQKPASQWGRAPCGDGTYGNDDEDLLLQSMISFMAHSVTDEECSAISSVSDRARALRRGRTSGRGRCLQ